MEDSHYAPISVVTHYGNLGSDGHSEGHYICDVKNKLSNTWYRTNDSKIPMMISIKDVSKTAYVVLYKRK